jgi:hypothetical protein
MQLRSAAPDTGRFAEPPVTPTPGAQLMRVRVLLLVATALWSGCSGTRGSPYTAYAAAIETTADSILWLAHQVEVRQRKGPEPIVGDAGRAMQVLAKDFDAHTPPPDLNRLHEQLSSSLNVLASKFAVLGGREAANCSDYTECRVSMILAVAFALSNRREYIEARGRARRMLSEHGAELPELPSTLQPK